MSKNLDSKCKRDRIYRLKDGRCPIHGISMPQIGFTESEIIVQCPRRDCEIKAFEFTPYINAELLPEYKYLIK